MLFSIIYTGLVFLIRYAKSIPKVELGVCSFIFSTLLPIISNNSNRSHSRQLFKN